MGSKDKTKAAVSKAEYLQKYLSGGDGANTATTKKRRKKKKPSDGEHAKVAKIKSTTKLVVEDDGMGPNVWGKRRGFDDDDEDRPMDEGKLALLDANTEAGPSIAILDDHLPKQEEAQEYEDSRWKATGFLAVDEGGEAKTSHSKRQRHDSGSDNDDNITGQGRARHDSESDSDLDTLPRGGRGGAVDPPSTADGDGMPANGMAMSGRGRARHDSESESDLDDLAQVSSAAGRSAGAPSSGRLRADSDSDSDLDVRRPTGQARGAGIDDDSDDMNDLVRAPKAAAGEDNKEDDAVILKKGTAAQRMADGSRAGLRLGTLIKEDAEAAKFEREANIKRLADDAGGRTAATVYRDKKTGKMVAVKDLVAQKRKEDEEKRLEKEHQADVNRGVVQRTTESRKAHEMAYEMGKSFARHKDDADLENHLKDADNENDPMMKFFAEKKKRERKAKGIKEKPIYKGDFPPNRFNIRPGYRWSGAVRSNGFEEKYLLTHNTRQANYNDYFKWAQSNQ